MRNSRKMAGVVAVVAAAAFNAPIPAYAALPGDGGKLNMWENDSYGGHFEARVGYDSDFHNDEFNDKLSSYINKTDNWWVLYVDVNYGGDRVCVKPRSHDANIGNNTNYEDDISSVDKKGTTEPAGCDVIIGYAN